MSKITAYGSASAKADLIIPVVDPDDTTMAPSGTTKKTTFGAMLALAGPLLTQTAVKTANYTAAANEIVRCDTTSASFTVTLPTAPAAGTLAAVKHIIIGVGNQVTVACGGSDVINKSGGGTSLTETVVNQGVLLHYQSGIWVDLADDLPLGQLDTRYLHAASNVTVTQWLAQSNPLVAHRGFAQVAPEDTLASLISARSVMLGAGIVPAVKIDAQMLNDGTLAVMHDGTVSRTTTSAGNVANYTAQAWQTLSCPAGTLLGPAWPSQSVPLLSDVLDRLGGLCVFIIDPKTSSTATTAAILAMITQRNLQSSCLITYEDTTLALPALCKAAGVGFLYYFNTNAISSAPTPATVAATSGVSGIAIGITNAYYGGTAYADSDITSVVSACTAASIWSSGFTYITRHDYQRAVTLGLTVHQADDPYVTGSTARRTSDFFTAGAPVPGEPGSTFPSTAIATAPTYQYAGAAGNYRRAFTNSPVQAGIYECLGFLAPAANAGTGIYTISGTAFWDATETGSSDGGRFASIMVGCSDDYPFNGNPILNGYNCLIRQGNGSSFTSPTFQIFKQVRGSYQNNGLYASGTSTQLTGALLANTTAYAAPNTLGASYASGATITSLTLGSAVTIPAGMKIALPNGQIATVASAVSASATVPVSSITLTSALTSGQAVFFGIPFSIKVDCSVAGQTTITFKRTDTNDTLTATDNSSPFGGGYCHIGKTGVTSGSTLAVSFANLSIS